MHDTHQTSASVAGSKCLKSLGESTLPSRGGVLVDGSRAGDLIQNRTYLAEFGFGGCRILLLNSIEEGLDLSLHASLAPVVYGVSLG